MELLIVLMTLIIIELRFKPRLDAIRKEERTILVMHYSAKKDGNIRRRECIFLFTT